MRCHPLNVLAQFFVIVFCVLVERKRKTKEVDESQRKISEMFDCFKKPRQNEAESSAPAASASVNIARESQSDVYNRESTSESKAANTNTTSVLKSSTRPHVRSLFQSLDCSVKEKLNSSMTEEPMDIDTHSTCPALHGREDESVESKTAEPTNGDEMQVNVTTTRSDSTEPHKEAEGTSQRNGKKRSLSFAQRMQSSRYCRPPNPTSPKTSPTKSKMRSPYGRYKVTKFGKPTKSASSSFLQRKQSNVEKPAAAEPTNKRLSFSQRMSMSSNFCHVQSESDDCDFESDNGRMRNNLLKQRSRLRLNKSPKARREYTQVPVSSSLFSAKEEVSSQDGDSNISASSQKPSDSNAHCVHDAHCVHNVNAHCVHNSLDVHDSHCDNGSPCVDNKQAFKVCEEKPNLEISHTLSISRDEFAAASSSNAASVHDVTSNNTKTPAKTSNQDCPIIDRSRLVGWHHNAAERLNLGKDFVRRISSLFVSTGSSATREIKIEQAADDSDVLVLPDLHPIEDDPSDFVKVEVETEEPIELVLGSITCVRTHSSAKRKRKEKKRERRDSCDDIFECTQCFANSPSDPALLKLNETLRRLKSSETESSLSCRSVQSRPHKRNLNIVLPSQTDDSIFELPDL